MKKHLILSFLLILFTGISAYLGEYFGDLAGIGGYDGFAPQNLYLEFQTGQFSGTFLGDHVEIIAMFCLAIGIIGFPISILYFAVSSVIGFWRILKRRPVHGSQ